MAPLESLTRKLLAPRFLLGVAVWILFAFIFREIGGFRFLNALELETLTLRQKMFADSPQDARNVAPVTIVAIDSKTLSSERMAKIFGRVWLNRSLYGYAIRFFRRGNPRSVVFDMSFNGGTAEDLSAGDRYMVESLRGSNRFISTLMFDTVPQKGLDYASHPLEVREGFSKNAVSVTGLERFPHLMQYRFQSLAAPFTALLNSDMRFYSAKGSALDSNEDQTGTLRRWVPFSIFGDKVFPTLPLGAVIGNTRSMTLSPDGLLRWKGGKVDLGATGTPLIKWYGHASRSGKQLYPEYHFWDVVESELVLQCNEDPGAPLCDKVELPKTPVLSPDVFRGRIILINSTFENSYDNHKTIYDLQYPGVYIVANELDNLWRNDFVHQAPWWVDALLVAFYGFIAVWLCLRFRSVPFVILGLTALSLAHFSLTYFAYARANLWINFIGPLLAIVAIFSGTYAYRFLQGEKLRQQMRYAFGKYVSPAVLSQLENNPNAMKLGGQKKELTLLFCDIRGFTAFSETHEPEIVQHFLSQYFGVMNDLIMNKFGGSINKLMGDAIMAYWGFPIEKEDHAFWAVSAAMAMRDVLAEWHADPEKPPLNIGIGINTGTVLIGNVGSQDFMDFTVIGDAVNLASRLESMNKEFGTNIIIAESTYEKIKDRLEARCLGTVRVRGKEQEVKIYEPVGLYFS